MGTDNPSPQLKRHLRNYVLGGCLTLGAFPIAWFGQLQVKASLQTQEPEVMLVLGGAEEREQYAAQFAQSHPEVRVWVSGGSNPEYARWVFQTAKIKPERVRLDYQAVDTVTNFTTLVDDLKAENIDCVYLVTSDYHMRRAKVIGQIVLGSQGIAFKPLAVPSEAHQPETLLRSIRDGARAVLWVLTGRTGSDWAQTLNQLKLLS